MIDPHHEISLLVKLLIHVIMSGDVTEITFTIRFRPMILGWGLLVDLFCLCLSDFG